MPDISLSDKDYESMGKDLENPAVSITEKYRIVYTLKNIGTAQAVDALARGLGSESALLKHEIAYAMGQMGQHSAVPILKRVLENREENSMVRHEAGEALGAIATPECRAIVEQFVNDDAVEVAETCQIAVDRIDWVMSGKLATEDLGPEAAYRSVDPAPPVGGEPVASLQAQLLDTSLSLFQRYRAMFALRNDGSKEAIQALVSGFADSSALFRHEIAFVLGQMQQSATAEALKEVLSRPGEHPMVRHEAAEALGAIATDDVSGVLRDHLHDRDEAVRESCAVALDITDYMTGSEFEYANALLKKSS